jgi:hypothetical protein
VYLNVLQPLRDDELPPYQEDHLLQHDVDGVPIGEGQWGPYVLTTSPTGRVWTRTFTSPDGTVITEVRLLDCLVVSVSCLFGF